MSDMIEKLASGHPVMSKDILSETGKEGLRVPLAPGSRPSDQAPAGLAASRVDPSRDAVLGFTGNRHGLARRQQDALCMALIGFREGGAEWMHNGDCVGSDEYAGKIWHALGGRINLWPPDVDRHRAHLEAEVTEHPKSYLARNRDIVNSCTVLIATPRERVEQQRSGTWSTIRYARMVGRPIMIIFPDGKHVAENWPHDSDEHRNGEDGNRLSGEAMPARASQEASPSPEIPNPGAPK
jgi:hypothetical protein